MIVKTRHRMTNVKHLDLHLIISFVMLRYQSHSQILTEGVVCTVLGSGNETHRDWNMELHRNQNGMRYGMRSDITMSCRMEQGLEWAGIVIMKLYLTFSLSMPSGPMTLSKMCFPTWESTALRGSSRRQTSASWYTERARLTRCFWPPLKLIPYSNLYESHSQTPAQYTQPLQ